MDMDALEISVVVRCEFWNELGSIARLDCKWWTRRNACVVKLAIGTHFIELSMLNLPRLCFV